MNGTARAPRFVQSERQKARHRLVVLGALAILGPPLSGLGLPVFWIPYACVILIYAAWTIRFTSSFDGERSLGLVLSILDIAMTLPLALWAEGIAVKSIVGAACIGGLIVSVRISRQASSAGSGDLRRAVRPRAAAVGHAPAADMARRLAQLLPLEDERFSIMLVRIARFDEIRAYYGGEVAARALAATARRATREAGVTSGTAELQSPDGRVVLVLPASMGPSLAFLAQAIGRRVNERLVDGHRIDCAVGWARSPEDGISVDELLRAAETNAAPPLLLRRAEEAVARPSRRAEAAAG